ncbi:MULTISPECIES: hypothetical protein [Mesorhizobium]|uniref:Uncharacterized protein n=3 Tax=Mesorhizobium TaxID=68287 RepID=Q8KGN9_RHILI|nr:MULTISPECIES: hypothetical protein [Mesorhizobium]MBZ9909413.1 hypothetical protein [Mesorhizobium sp. BR115XR7A]QJF04812.1 hypothetical protein R7A2020_30165 [Mesorhizobium japonicum R7A]QJF10881.1 hypothetical protein HID05_30155 [Mesorhizobium japonicum]QJI86754.1 hypothetical protein HKB46_30165 [Mesorhizobium japonicum]WQB96894.1 hypothetical protein U0R22_000971 [Mesorhizobium huakuii]
MVFGTHEPTQNRLRPRGSAIDAAIDHPVFATALRGHDGAAFGAQHDLRVPTLTLVNIHVIENAGSGDATGDVSDAAF